MRGRSTCTRSPIPPSRPDRPPAPPHPTPASLPPSWKHNTRTGKQTDAFFMRIFSGWRRCSGVKEEGETRRRGQDLAGGDGGGGGWRKEVEKKKGRAAAEGSGSSCSPGEAELFVSEGPAWLPDVSIMGRRARQTRLTGAGPPSSRPSHHRGRCRNLT